MPWYVFTLIIPHSKFVWPICNELGNQFGLNGCYTSPPQFPRWNRLFTQFSNWPAPSLQLHPLGAASKRLKCFPFQTKMTAKDPKMRENGRTKTTMAQTFFRQNNQKWLEMAPKTPKMGSNQRNDGETCPPKKCNGIKWPWTPCSWKWPRLAQ